MKNLLYLIIFFSITFSTINAQSIPSSNEDTLLYLTPTEVAFMIDKETKYLLKSSFSARPFPNAFAHFQNKISLEFKLNKSFSLSANFNSTSYIFFGNGFDSDFEIDQFSTGLELRYYPSLAKRIENGAQANNLSANYISVLTDYNSYPNSNQPELRTWTHGISYGMQRRFLNLGFLDYALALRSTKFNFQQDQMDTPTNRRYHQFSFALETNIGIGLGKRYTLGDDITCPIFKCFRSKQMALKFNINNLFFLQHTLSTDQKYDVGSQWFFYVNPNIIYEIKIGNTPLSFEQDLMYSFSLSTPNIIDRELTSHSFSYRAGVKYYFLQRKHIQQGKSGNNLSGAYFFGRGAVQQYRTTDLEYVEATNTFTVDHPIVKNVLVEVGYGYQQTVLKNLFYDLNLGLGKNVRSNYDKNKNQFTFVFDLKAGLIF